MSLGERTCVMAIVNLTPDSFSGDGVAAHGVEAGVRAGLEALDAGADVLDLGAESTRPGAEPIEPEVEHRRLLPVLEGILKARPAAVVSVDTYHALTALEAAKAGAEIINDVSGMLWDPGMAEAVAASGCGLVLMHTRGRATEWKAQPRLRPEDVMPTVMEGLAERMEAARAAGIPRGRIVVDPGFGFGKVGRENFTLLWGMEKLRAFGCPVLAGLSRKGFLGEAVRRVQREELPLAEARRIATISGNVAAILAGAHVVRVHDVQATREAAAVADAVLAGRAVDNCVAM